MAIHYLEASSMKELAIKIERAESGLGKWNDLKRSLSHISIQKDGDKFCAILSDARLLVTGEMSTYEQNNLNVYVQNNVIDVNINPGGSAPRVSTY